MRKKEETIRRAKIRKYIRDAIKWHKTDKGYIGYFWTSDDYRYSKKADVQKMYKKTYPYYVKSNRAIEDIAIKIDNLIVNKKTEIYQVQANIFDLVRGESFIRGYDFYSTYADAQKRAMELVEEHENSYLKEFCKIKYFVVPIEVK